MNRHHPSLPAGRRRQITTVVGLALGLAMTTALAALNEPDNIVFGTITVNGQTAGATNRNVAVEARRLDGSLIDRYQLGDDPAAGDHYVVEIPVETTEPLMDSGTGLTVGTLLEMIVLVDEGIQCRDWYYLADRGQVIRMDLGGGGVTVTADQDDDGLDDAWEVAHFGCLDVSAGGDQDNDGDGISDYREMLAGTDPLDPDSYLRVVNASISATGTVIEWSSSLGRNYVVEVSTNGVAGAFWQPVSGTQNSTPPMNSCVVEITDHPSFFRIRLVTDE